MNPGASLRKHMYKRHHYGLEAHKVMWPFGHVIAQALSLCLFCALVALPLGPAFADEVQSQTETATTPLDTQALPVTTKTSQIPILENTPPPAPPETTPNSEDEGVVATSPDETTTSTPETTPVVSEETTSSSTQETAIEDGPSNTTTSDATEGEGADVSLSEDVNVDAEGTSTDESEDATTTEENLVTAGSLTNDANRYSFSKNECTVVGDGSYYCAKTKDASMLAHEDRIFAATDKEGDKEIFVEHDGELTQLTFNQVEDDAPYYDAVSDSVVWHRLLDGRYQIISYSFKTKEETQITATSYNNMEPSRYGDAIVWQAWVDTNWEIMLSLNGTTTQLTDNAEADIAPNINKDYIVWQSQEGGVWYAHVYDRSTGEIESIENKDGLSIENARFVLVYDAKGENGDIETRGYDLKNKKEIPLSATPASVPENIPEPDGTKEKRALIQSTTTQLKQKATDEDASGGGGEGGGPDPLLGTATSSIPDVIIVPSTDIGSSTATSSAEIPLATDHIPELVVVPTTTTTVETPAHIEDLVIQAPTSTTVDPQGEVASST